LAVVSGGPDRVFSHVAPLQAIAATASAIDLQPPVVKARRF
jgi:hypothetical protein